MQLLSDVVVVLTAKGPERRTIEEAAAVDALPGVNVAETWQDPATFRALVPDGSPAHLLTKPAVEVATDAGGSSRTSHPNFRPTQDPWTLP